MVRYSKLPFRALMRDYGVDITYTPMILAKEFVRSEPARQSDFTTSITDAPLVVQFGAHERTDFARACEMVAPYCDGVDLNCGCPQSWAISEGVGAALMRKPELVAEMVREARKRVAREFCVSVKIRVHNDVEETRRWVETVLETGCVDYVTVHGRTRCTRSSVPVDLVKIRSVAEVCRRFGTPVLANGDVFSLEDAHRIKEFCGVDGNTPRPPVPGNGVGRGAC
jgi:tRNA-dihydrouridine synthase 4